MSRRCGGLSDQECRDALAAAGQPVPVVTDRPAPRRDVFDDRVFDAVEIRPARLPVIRIARHRDRLVRLELDELERAGADRMGAHVARQHVARVDRRPSGRQQCEKRRLRPLQMKGGLVVAIRRAAHSFFR